ncbi:MAG: sugar phosphate isomerase/epimerase [Planctomycetaceae bacterium]|nr:sugar phosphate isomerase/epimerase [Planctomycetaceae bacterium]
MGEGRIEDRLGLVSNCWKVQLDAGVSLSSLVQWAVAEGFRFVELRQGCLGGCEDSETRLPRADLLKVLAQDFPEITFDLAVELPVFSEFINVSAETVEAMLAGVRALSENDRPAHLRIVDLVSKNVPARRSAPAISVAEFALEDVVDSLLNLKAQLPAGILSVEHSFQSWTGFRQVVEAARSHGDSSTDAIKVCYDPCNLWLADDGEDANEITQRLPTEWLSMVHLKQRVGGSISTRLEPGDVDWPRQLELLNCAGYGGPFLFETAPSGDVWQCLGDSRDYLASIVCGT